MNYIGDIIQLGMLLIAVITIICTQKTANKQIRLQMFAEYTRRYQDIFINMPDDIYNGLAKVDARTKKYMRLYFDLCNEEFHLWKDGVVPNDTWKLWIEGMQIACNYQIYKNSWDAIKGEYDRDFWLYFERNVINYNKEFK